MPLLRIPNPFTGTTPDRVELLESLADWPKLVIYPKNPGIAVVSLDVRNAGRIPYTFWVEGEEVVLQTPQRAKKAPISP